MPAFLLDHLFYLELGAVIFNVLFIVFLIREERICWIYGIIASLLSVWLFMSFEKPLYSESLLYVFYALFGVYGWLNWGKQKGEVPISEWSARNHIIAFLCGLFGMLGLGYFFDNFSDADLPYADALSSSFSFVATYMEAKKILSGWIYWICLNAFTIWLYAAKTAYLYAFLMLVFTFLSIFGLIKWRKKFIQNHIQTQ